MGNDKNINVVRIIPKYEYENLPCSKVAVGCALEDNNSDNIKEQVLNEDYGLKEDGYLSLDNMNRYIRKYLDIQKKVYYKKGERPVLASFLESNDKKAVICLLGHYVYVNKNIYYSFFENKEDDIVCVWYLKDGYGAKK